MLSQEGLRERKWGPYPALRRVIEEKSVPADHYGFSSVDDNMFEALSRLLEVAVQIESCKADILEAATTVGADHICRDLERISGELDLAGNLLKQRAEEIEQLRLSI